ncbi:MAG: DEAD/DEAH box helicase, partial [Acidimicrobiales bacterium]
MSEGRAGPVAKRLSHLTAELPGGGEDRPGQLAMAEAVAGAIASRRHLIVQAGTGTGKSLAYLVALAESGSKAVVATATKALQDQLATKDLPFVASELASERELTYTVLKGRSNYLCRQRARETSGPAEGAMSFDEAADRAPDSLTRLGDEVMRILAWAETSPTGDR